MDTSLVGAGVVGGLPTGIIVGGPVKLQNF